MALAGNSDGGITKRKTTVKCAIEKFERLGLLDVEHGRYDHVAKRRAGNIYHVPPRAVQAALAPDQGPRPRAPYVHDQGPPTRPIIGDSRIGESRIGDRKEKKENFKFEF